MSNIIFLMAKKLIKEQSKIIKDINKHLSQIEKEVLIGSWGCGLDRIHRLENAGYDYNSIQRKINIELERINKK